MYCNRCCKQQQPAAQCIATNCLHLFCIECAKQAFEADCICPVCQTSLTKSNIKLVRVLNDSSEELDLALVGQTPERVSRASQVAVNFYLQQAQLSFQLTERSYKAKITKVQQAAKKKLDEVHKGYQAAKRKYHEVAEERDVMNQEMTELQEKYSQKAAQASNLSETAARLQAENEHLLATLHQQGIRLPQPSYRHQHHRPSPPGASTPRTGQIVPFQPLPGFASAQRHQSIHQSHQYGSNRRQSISPREPSPNQQQPPPGFPNLPSSHGGLLSPHMSPPPPNGRSHNDMARPSQHPAVHSSQQFQPGLKATLPQQLHQFNPRHQQHHQQMGGRQLKQPPLPGFPASPSNVATM